MSLTKGVDVGAKAEIYAIMGDLAKKGYAIVLISFRNAGDPGNV